MNRLRPSFVFACLLSFACNESRLHIRAIDHDADVGDGSAGTFDAPASIDTAAPPTTDTAPGPSCGNGVVDVGETCDDGNARPGDGCSGLCRIEPNYACPTVNAPCVSLIVCGDGKVNPPEACDDGNAAAGDGCSDTCQVEAG